MHIFAILLALLWWVGVNAEIQVAILMQGSDFINVSFVPLYDVNQFDLGDVFISPCRAGTYNEHRDSFCKPCDVCTHNQYERSECIAIRNRVCGNCTVCTPKQQQVCACNQRTAECVTGNSVCNPLPRTTANISFELSVSQPLSSLKERFLQEGLRTGFVLFLSTYLRHPDDSIVLLVLRRIDSTQYFTTFLIDDMYSLYTKRQAEIISKAVVQEGLTNTFGVQSNTFSTVSQQRRRMRRLLNQDPVFLFADGVKTQCLITGSCTEFFVMSNSENPCESKCVSLPCPPGYTGILGICEICPNATYKDTHGNATCTACPVGWVSDRGTKGYEGCRPPSVSTPIVVIDTTSAAETTYAPITSASPSLSGQTHLQSESTALGLSPVYVPLSSSLYNGTQATIRTISIPLPVTTSLSASTLPSSVSGSPSTTPSPPGPGGWYGEHPILQTNYQIFNISLVQNLFFPEWNSGKAGTVMYVTINEEREDWAMGVAGGLMVAGFLAIVAIGARLFWGIQRPSTGQARGTAIVVEDGDGKTVIPVPVKQGKPSPSPPSVVRRTASPPKRAVPLPFAHLGSVYRRQPATD